MTAKSSQVHGSIVEKILQRAAETFQRVAEFRRLQNHEDKNKHEISLRLPPYRRLTNISERLFRL